MYKNKFEIFKGNINNCSDKDYLFIVQEICESIKNNKLIPFLGAGISYCTPSNIPQGCSLKRPLIECIESARQKLIPNINLTDDVEEKYKYIIENSSLENYLDVFRSVYRDKYLNYLIKNIDSKRKTNINHKVLAHISKRYSLPYIITLNFDVLIERAFNEIKCSCKTKCPIVGYEFYTGNENKCNTLIIKPHGSFSSLEIKENRAQNISTTLEQLGDHSNLENINIITDALKSCPILLISGYSNEDWDIFPILENNSGLIQRVYWNHYPSTNHEPIGKVAEWLSEMGDRAVLLIGDIRDLNNHIAEKLDLNDINKSLIHINTEQKNEVKVKSADIFSDDYMNLFALGNLLTRGGDRKLSYLIYKKLYHSNISCLTTKYHLLRSLSFAYHLKGMLYDSVLLNLKHIKLLKNNKIDTNVQIGDDYIWLSFQLFSLLKPHNIFRGLQVVLFPVLFIIGVIYKEAGEKYYKEKITIDDGTTIKYSLKRIAYSRQYYLEMIHSWANLFIFIFGDKFSSFRYYLFRFIQKYQINLEKTSPGFNKHDDYFWLRYFDSLVFSNGINDNNAQRYNKKIDKIIKSNEMTGKDPGNGYIYMALLLYLMKQTNNEADIKKFIKNALDRWNTEGDNYNYGLYRIIYIARYIKRLSFHELLKYFITSKRSEYLYHKLLR